MLRLLYKQVYHIKPPSSHIHETLKWSRTIEARLYRSNNVGTASRSISHKRNHQSNCTVMLSDKYLWPVPELTPVHEAYELASFQEPVTPLASSRTYPGPQGVQASLVPGAGDTLTAHNPSSRISTATCTISPRSIPSRWGYLALLQSNIVIVCVLAMP
jgi:hypothetical protein